MNSARTLNSTAPGLGLFSPSAGHQRVAILGVAAWAMCLGWFVAEQQWLFVVATLLVPVILMYPVQTALGAFTLMIPFDAVAALSDKPTGMTLTWFVGAGAGAILLALGFAGRRFRRPPVSALWWTLFLVWGAASALWAIDPRLTLKLLPTAVASVGLFFVTTSVRITNKELSFVVKLAIIGGCAAAIWAAYTFFQGGLHAEGTMRGSLIVGGRQANPNLFGVTMLTPIACAVGALLSAKRWLTKACVLGALGLTTLGLLVTMSRGALLALIAMFIVFLIRFRVTFRTGLLLAVSGILLAVMPSLFFTRLQQAFASRGAGRLDIWTVGVELIRHYWVFGAGLNNFQAAYTKFAGYAPHFLGFDRDAHNVYLAVCVDAGLIGLILFGAAVSSQLHLRDWVRRNTKVDPTWFAFEAACCALLVAGFFENVLWEKTFWLAWMLLGISEQARRHDGEPVALTQDAKEPPRIAHDPADLQFSNAQKRYHLTRLR